MLRVNKKDFYIPFEWEERCPIIIEKLLYVPIYYDKHHLFENKNYFENTNPINIEYCSGSGQWIIEKAKKNPDINYIAVEIKFQRARNIWIRMHNEKINNLFVVMGDALTFTKYYLNDGTVSEIFINFPDPWPKKKHAKHRIVCDEFIQEMHRIMNKNKIITLVTDDISYRDQMIGVFQKNNDFKPIYKKPYYIQNFENFGDSFFYILFKKKKKIINFLKYKKK